MGTKTDAGIRKDAKPEKKPPGDQAAGKVREARKASDVKREADSFDKAVGDAKGVLERKRPQDAKLAQRLGQLVDKLADKKVDDSYMTGHSIFYQQFSEKRRPLRDLVQHARPKLEKLMREPDSVHLGKGKYQDVPASDDVKLARLKKLNEDILSGPELLQRKQGTDQSTISPAFREVNDWMRQKAQSGDSILKLYIDWR